jgi:hypothetical protein
MPEGCSRRVGRRRGEPGHRSRIGTASAQSEAGSRPGMRPGAVLAAASWPKPAGTGLALLAAGTVRGHDPRAAPGPAVDAGPEVVMGPRKG